jgi:hypothetical protein
MLSAQAKVGYFNRKSTRAVACFTYFRVYFLNKKVIGLDVTMNKVVFVLIIQPSCCLAQDFL